MTRRVHGFTLVEVMAALVITGMVVAAAGALTVQAVKTQRGLATRADVLWLRADALDAFEADTAGVVRAGEAAEPVLLAWGEGEDVLLRLISLADVPQAESPGRRRLPQEVTYLLVPATGTDSDGGRLVRRVRDLTLKDVASRDEVVAEDVQRAWVEALIEEEWTAEAPDARDDGEIRDMPRALRLSIVWASRPQQVWTRTVVLESRR